MQGNEMNIYFIKKWFLRKYFKLRRKTPADMPMVRYWKKQDAVKGKVTTLPDGALGMYMEGEDYPISGVSRGHMLFGNYRGTGHGPLSVLKHTIKNEVFNYIWYALEDGKSKEEIVDHIKKVALPKLEEINNDLKYDLIPPEKMFSSMREIWRTLTVLEKKYQSNNIKIFKESLALIGMDDDSYMIRIKWITQIFPGWFNPIKNFDLSLQELEVAEVVGDMKERIRLMRAGLLLLLTDKKIRQIFLDFCKEVDWKKLKLTKADMYHLRAKYFKADLIRFEY